ncbi:MAG: carbon-nitrogen hydrolase family protein [Planctomycetes bacterium]|nr:carbon-nitrogen hydrolase family protein [Planctomycetota bacterium]
MPGSKIMLMSRRSLLGAATASAVTAVIVNQSAGGDVSAPQAPEPNRNTKTLRLGLFQQVPVKWDLKANLAAFLDGVETAATKGVDLLVAPECFLDGYAASDPASTRAKLAAVAQDAAKSPHLGRVAEAAAKRRMSIVFGFTQKDGDAIYNSAGLWDARGQLTGVYHKTHLQTHDKQFDRGEALPVFESPWGALGIMICADRRWPETARVLRLQGARLILCPAYGMRHEANEWWMRTRAYENDCFVAFAHPSVGFVADPGGNLAGKLSNSPGGVLAVDLDLSKADRHAHLDDRRPDLYGLIAQQPKDQGAASPSPRPATEPSTKNRPKEGGP